MLLRIWRKEEGRPATFTDTNHAFLTRMVYDGIPFDLGLFFGCKWKTGI